jgi:transposase
LQPLFQARRIVPQRSSYEKEQYKLRQKVERFFHKLKPCRRIATRYDTLRRTLLAFIHLAAVWIMVR